MSQSKRASLAETLTNFIAGISLSIFSYWLLLPLFGIHIPLTANLSLTAYFAFMSIIKTYIIRRSFNRATVRHKMRRMRPSVGSIQSLPRQGRVPQMSVKDYQDLADKTQRSCTKRPVRRGTQRDANTGRKKD